MIVSYNYLADHFLFGVTVDHPWVSPSGGFVRVFGSRRPVFSHHPGSLISMHISGYHVRTNEYMYGG